MTTITVNGAPHHTSAPESVADVMEGILGVRIGAEGALPAGTTLGMMIANVPAVFAGDALTRRVSLKAIRIVAAVLFVAIGLLLAAQTAGWI